MDFDKRYRKMIDYIDSYTPYRIIGQYFEPMVLSDKTRLIDALIRKSDDHFGWFSGKNQDDENYFPRLFDLAKKYYSIDYLRAVIAKAEKDKWYSRLNGFLTYVKENVAAQNN